MPIPGTKRRSYLEENIAAVAIRLNEAQLKALDEALTPDKVSGLRYNEKLMATVDR